MNCSKCGQPVRVVPAGVSKKTGKPYGSFYKCEACQNSVQIGVQPAKPQYQPPQGQPIAINPQLTRIEAKLDTLITMLTEPEGDITVGVKDETGF